MTAANDPKKVIEGEVLTVQKQQAELAELQQALSANPEFSRFMELSKAVTTKMAEVRQRIEEVMVPAYVAGLVDKNLKFDGGSVTVTESDKFEIDQAALPPKFFKKVVDETKVRDTYHLEGKPPKGCKPFKKYGIMLKIK